MNDNTRQEPTLVLNGTGKIGRRVVERLTTRGLPVRIGSRSGEPRFDWEDRSTWDPVLEGVGSAYVSHYWDAIPGAAETLGLFAELAVESGVRRLVLLSGRGEEEAERAERAVQGVLSAAIAAPLRTPSGSEAHRHQCRHALPRSRPCGRAGGQGRDAHNGQGRGAAAHRGSLLLRGARRYCCGTAIALRVP